MTSKWNLCVPQNCVIIVVLIFVCVIIESYTKNDENQWHNVCGHYKYYMLLVSYLPLEFDAITIYTLQYVP